MRGTSPECISKYLRNKHIVLFLTYAYGATNILELNADTAKLEVTNAHPDELFKDTRLMFDGKITALSFITGV